jgi:hypothetical protein
VGLFLPLDDALLSRACATVLPAETADELTMTCVPSVQVTIGITQQALLGNDSLDLGGGVAVVRESVEIHASDITTKV